MRRGDVVVAIAQALFELGEGGVNLGRLAIDLGRAAPHHGQAIATVVGLEALDVVHQLLGQLHLRRALLDVGTVELLDPLLGEHRAHRLDRRELFADLVEQILAEHAGPDRGVVAVLGEDVPAAEDQVVEGRQRDVVADRRNPVLRTFAEADGAHLGERSDWHRQLLPDRHATGDERGRDRAHSGEQDAELFPWRV